MIAGTPYRKRTGVAMSIGDIIVYLIAAVALVAFAAILLANWRAILHDIFIFLASWAVIGVILLAIGLVGAGGVLAYVYLNDRNMMQKCSTAHERREKAYAAPDDYFGRRLREESIAEAKECAEFAAHKEAAKRSEK
jgi:hypothetical protein